MPHAGGWRSVEDSNLSNRSVLFHRRSTVAATGSYIPCQNCTGALRSRCLWGAAYQKKRNVASGGQRRDRTGNLPMCLRVCLPKHLLPKKAPRPPERGAGVFLCPYPPDRYYSKPEVYQLIRCALGLTATVGGCGSSSQGSVNSYSIVVSLPSSFLRTLPLGCRLL